LARPPGTAACSTSAFVRLSIFFFSLLACWNFLFIFVKKIQESK
jgi:hypothetical protein